MPNPTLALVSQSGALASQLEQFAFQQRIGLTHIVSTGNEADVTVADAIEYLATQPEPRAIALFLETVRQPQRFVAAISAARAARKPVVILKVGASEASAKAAQAHTGSLVGNDRIFSALCRQLGMIRAHSLEELIVTADLAGRLPPDIEGGLALLAMSGGLCEIAIDRSEEIGLRLPKLAAGTTSALRSVLPPMASPNNPMDLTGAAMLEPELITRSITTAAQDPAVGAVAFVFDVPPKADKRGFARTFIKHVSDGFAAIDKPGLLLSHTVSGVTEDSRALVDEFNLIYSGSGIDLGLKAIARILAARKTQVDRSAPPHARDARPRAEREVLDHLATQGVPVIPAIVARSPEDAAAAARSFGGRVVLKVAAPDIQHKTEAGGVVLDLCGDEAVRAAYEGILTSVQSKHPRALIDGILVSPMRNSGTELFVGTMCDPQWGPAIAVGLGGIWIEALKDSSLRLLPIEPADALEMLDELRGSTLLHGFRGTPAIDRAALARAIVDIGNAAVALGPELVTLEINPLLASAHGVEALDGLAVWQ